MSKVFVLNKEGRPLMPTTERKARLLCESGKAKRVRRNRSCSSALRTIQAGDQRVSKALF